MTDEELCGRLRSMLPASGFAPTENWAPWLGADRIEQLEREKAVVSELWEQQKEIALGYLADCNKAADRIEQLQRELAEAKEALAFYATLKCQHDCGAATACSYDDGYCAREALAKMESRA